MLAPFVLNLLISCSCSYWPDGPVTRFRPGSASRGVLIPADSQRKAESGQRLDHAALTACTSCGTSGEWLWKIDHPELN